MPYIIHIIYLLEVIVVALSLIPTKVSGLRNSRLSPCKSIISELTRMISRWAAYCWITVRPEIMDKRPFVVQKIIYGYCLVTALKRKEKKWRFRSLLCKGGLRIWKRINNTRTMTFYSMFTTCIVQIIILCGYAISSSITFFFTFRFWFILISRICFFKKKIVIFVNT